MGPKPSIQVRANKMDLIRLFLSSMAQDQIITNAPIIPDGILHRFHIKGDKMHTRNGWYVLYSDGIASGAYGSWKMSLSKKWCSKSRNQMSIAQWQTHLKKMEEAQRQRDEAKAAEQQRASTRATVIWEHSQLANPNHTYFLNKDITPFNARQRGDTIILPIIDCQNTIWSLEFIHPDGSKFLLTGGAKRAHHILVNGSLDLARILICEGFATGATLAKDHPSACVIAAIDAGNLEPVATSIRRYKPHSEIIICADDDRQTPGNPGKTKGRHAAIAAGALLALPQWPSSAPSSLTDYNDLACWRRRNTETMA